MVESILDAGNQRLSIRGHVRDSRDAELVQEMSDLCEFHSAYSKDIVFGISRGQRSRLLFPRSPVERSSECDDQSTCRFIVIQGSSIVRIDITSKCNFCSCSESSTNCSSETQWPVFRAVEVPKHAHQSDYMLIAQVMIVPAENSIGICDITLSGGHPVHEDSDYRLVYSWIAGFFVRLSLVKLHCHWSGNMSGLGHSELRQGRWNVALLIDVNRVKLPIVVDVNAGIEGVTHEIMHPEPLLLRILDLPNQALIINDKEIIDVQNDCGNNCAMILMAEHEQSSVDTRCQESNQDHKVIISAISHVRGLLQAIKGLSQPANHLQWSLWSWIIESVLSLDQLKIFLRRVHLDLFLQGNSQESRAYVHLMNLVMIHGGDCECYPNVVWASSWCRRW